MKKTILALAFGAALASLTASCSGAKANAETSATNTDTTSANEIATVYYIKDITPENMVKIYEALGRKPQGKVGIKISTGESKKSNQLDTALISDFVRAIGGNFIECNTAYAGNRNTTEKHYQTAKEHGYVDLAGVDIMDGEGEVDIPVEGGKYLNKDIVGKNFLNYDFIAVLSHFKGHQMGGFGGALKNISIGIASSNGKAYIHSAGKTQNADSIWSCVAKQDAFLESMADACKGVIDHIGKDKMIYINVANNLSIDCDCNGNPAAPEMKDLGILASLDPVALDRACVDMVLNSDDPGKAHLIERMNKMHGPLILDAAELLGIGSQKYNLIELK